MEKTIKLEKESELRVQMADQSVGLELIDGLAEIYGTEMERNKIYMFPHSISVAVFSWHGCSIKVLGTPADTYVSSETLMILPVTLHACLEHLRITAETENRKGPVTLIVGPTDSGKSTFCRLLLNYAVRLGRKPFLIDLDVGQNSLSIPGTINVLNVVKPADIVEGFDQESILAYHFGYKSPGQLISLYYAQIKRIGNLIQTRLKDTNRNARSSGVIIDSCGWTRGDGYNAITLAAMSFEIDKLVVVEEERLYTQLKKDMPSCVEVLFIPRMGGVVERSRNTRAQHRDKRVKEYFYGPLGTLNPHSFEINYSDVTIVRVNLKTTENTIDDSNVNDFEYCPVPLGPRLVNHILALSYADAVSQEMAFTHIIGFICVTNVDMNRKVITILSPQPEPLPKKVLLMGDIKFYNSGF